MKFKYFTFRIPTTILKLKMTNQNLSKQELILTLQLSMKISYDKMKVYLRKKLLIEKQKNARAECIQQTMDAKYKRELSQLKLENERLQTNNQELKGQVETKSETIGSLTSVIDNLRTLLQESDLANTAVKMEYESKIAKLNMQLTSQTENSRLRMQQERNALMFKSDCEKGALIRNGLREKQDYFEQTNNNKLEYESKTGKWNASLNFTTQQKYDSQHAILQAENSRLQREIKNQQLDINNLKYKNINLTDRKSNAYKVTIKLISMIASQNLYNAANCTREFLSKHVPTNLGSINTPLVFNDLDDPIIRAVIQVCTPETGKNKFVGRLEELYHKGYHNSYQGPCKISSLLMGSYVADFSSNSTNSISMSFRTVTTTHLKKKLNLFNHYGP